MNDLDYLRNEITFLKTENEELQHILSVERGLLKFWQDKYNEVISEHAYEVANIKLENKA